MNSSSSDDTQPFHRNDCYFSRMMALRNAYSRIIWQPISTKSNGSIESNRSSSWIRLRHVHFFVHGLPPLPSLPLCISDYCCNGLTMPLILPSNNGRMSESLTYSSWMTGHSLSSHAVLKKNLRKNVDFGNGLWI